MSSVTTFEAGCVDALAIFEEETELHHQRQMRKEYLEEFARRDEELIMAHSRTCPTCKHRLHRHGKTKGTEIITAFGKVKIRLIRLRCRSCGFLITPGRLLIPLGSVTALASERMCDLVSKMPYGKAADSLFKQHRIKLSDKKYWEVVQTEASSIEDVLAKRAERLYTYGEPPPSVDLERKKPLVIGIDGGHIAHWKNTEGHESFEVKCVTMATGSLPGPGKKRHLRDRVGYSADTDTQTFGQRVSALALSCGYMSASKTIFISDGAKWIPELIDTYFPGSTHLLDMYHLKRRIQDTFTRRDFGCLACYRRNALAAADAYKPLLLLHILTLWKPTEQRRLELREELIEYVSNNLKAIAAHRTSHLHGSGWIEKGVDLMISRRLKNRGMSWTRPGASHMIGFEVLLYNNEWEQYWKQRRGQESIREAA